MDNKDTTTTFGIFKKMAIPEGATPVSDFDVNKYIGRWFEIARMDFFWEKKSLTNCYAEYTPNNDGTIDVKNTGYNENKDKWVSFEGEARFRNDNTVGALEVSFFGGIAWAGYNVISVDDDYSYALVFGRNTDYLWFLSRDRELPEYIKLKYLKLAEDAGYDVSKINWPDQSRPLPEPDQVVNFG